MTIFRLFLTLALVVAVADSAKIVLLHGPGGAGSHKEVHYPIAKGLIAKGHEVTMISMWPSKKKMEGLTEIVLDNTRNTYIPIIPAMFDDKGPSTVMGWGFLLKFEYNIFSKVSRAWYEEPEIQRLLKERPFDLAIVNGLFTTSILPAAAHMAKQIIYLAPGELVPTLAWNLNIPFPVYQVFNDMSEYTVQMSFFQRLLNSINVYGFIALRELFIFPGTDALVKEFIPNSPSAKDIEKRMELVMVNMHHVVDDCYPSLPFVVQVGGITCSPAKPLPKDLEQFVSTSGEHGIIVVSFGTLVPEDLMPKHAKEALFEAFRRIPQKVIFKFKSEVPNLPPNVKLMSWIPQNDLVGHPKTKALIAHGGHFSFLEAVYHGVPLLGFPVYADQYANSKRSEEKLLGMQMNWRTVTADKLVAALNKVVNDTEVRKSLKRHQALLKDEPMPVSDRVIFWIEHILRHGGRLHLRAEGADRLNVFQYLMLDIVAFVSAVILLYFYIVYKIIRCCCCRSKSKASPSKKSKKTN